MGFWGGALSAPHSICATCSLRPPPPLNLVSPSRSVDGSTHHHEHPSPTTSSISLGGRATPSLPRQLLYHYECNGVAKHTHVQDLSTTQLPRTDARPHATISAQPPCYESSRWPFRAQTALRLVMGVLLELVLLALASREWPVLSCFDPVLARRGRRHFPHVVPLEITSLRLAASLRRVQGASCMGHLVHTTSPDTHVPPFRADNNGDGNGSGTFHGPTEPPGDAPLLRCCWLVLLSILFSVFLFCLFLPF
mmetsp:Transcript_46967/g.69538  ORF Transcript_46967/g.69538 Transcript_46967/m.69538 type:complete len:251 (-) Transcript_46967:237-989(-)